MDEENKDEIIIEYDLWSFIISELIVSKQIELIITSMLTNGVLHTGLAFTLHILMNGQQAEKNRNKILELIS